MNCIQEYVCWSSNWLHSFPIIIIKCYISEDSKITDSPSQLVQKNHFSTTILIMYLTQALKTPINSSKAREITVLLQLSTHDFSHILIVLVQIVSTANKWNKKNHVRSFILRDFAWREAIVVFRMDWNHWGR